MDDSNRINPGHTTVRSFLRVAGPVTLGIGAILMIVALVDFFSAMGTPEGPRLFWCFFVAMPFLFLGFIMTGAGYMGLVLRYQAAEMAPVGKDTINYTAAGIKPAIRDVTEAVVQGMDDARSRRSCAKCGVSNDGDAAFCKSCGQKLTA